MKEALALVAYGLLLIAGFFMTFFWGRISWRRHKQFPSWRAWIHDTYMIIALSLCVSSIGTGVLFSARAYSFMVQGISTVTDATWYSWSVLMGLFIMGSAKVGFVWAIHLDRRSWVWRAFIALSCLWALIAVWWALYDPLNIYPYDGGQGHEGQTNVTG